MEIRNYNINDIEEIIKLNKINYNEEKNTIKYLKPISDFSDFIGKMFYNRFGKNAFGKILLHNQEIIGYLIGIRIDNFWGESIGFLSPIHGHFVYKEYREAGYQLLYKTLAEDLVKNKIFSHAITMYTYDDSLINTWFNLGFGLRCIDSIKKLEVKPIDKDFEIQRLTKENAADFAALTEEFHMMFTKSPIFIPRTEVNGLDDIIDIISKENQFMFGACLNNKPVGIIELGAIGDNFITTHNKMMNIKGLYVDSNYRNKGIAKNLLTYIENFLVNKDYELLGVDFEAFNIYGRKFWYKYFEPYTKSVHRRIDEHIYENYK
ncbi:MAG: GNAT family N-acetyltransferase [Candidatus Izimaplasma sp.]|nr:GNAT family N-acetyltransferase [Candidatus Izimaplasma bacterium]